MGLLGCLGMDKVHIDKIVEVGGRRMRWGGSQALGYLPVGPVLSRQPRILRSALLIADGADVRGSRGSRGSSYYLGHDNWHLKSWTPTGPTASRARSLPDSRLGPAAAT